MLVEKVANWTDHIHLSPWLSLLGSALKPGLKGQLTQDVQVSSLIELEKGSPLYI